MHIMSPRRIQTTLLTGNPSRTPAAPQFAVKPDLTDVLAAKYGGIQVPLQQQSGPPESAFKPHKVYVSPYQDTALQELTAKIDKNKIKQGKRWNKMIRKIQKRSHREKYMIPVSDSQQKRRADSNKTDSVKKPRSKLKVKLPGIAKKVSKIKPPKRPRRSKRCEVLGKVQTKIAGYSYKHKKTGKTVTVLSYTKKVLKCLDK